jgi:hypothetical protein
MVSTAGGSHGVANADRHQHGPVRASALAIRPAQELRLREELLGAHMLAASPMRLGRKSARTDESRGAGNKDLTALNARTQRSEHMGHTAARCGAWSTCKRPDEAKVRIPSLPPTEALAVQHVGSVRAETISVISPSGRGALAIEYERGGI